MSSAGPPVGGAGPRDRDRGLQPERTALAWQRTGLAAAAGSLVGVRDALVTGDAVVLVPALGALVAAAVVLRRSRTELAARVAALRAGLPLPAPVATYAAVAAVVSLCVTVLALVLA